MLKTPTRLEATVLEAVNRAFAPTHTENNLFEMEGRVFGSVTVVGSEKFDNLNDLRRQNHLWQQLRELLGSGATQIGPIVLKPTNRG